MAADYFISDSQEGAIRTIAALDPWLLTDAAHPLVATSRGVTGAGFLAYETARIHIFTPPE